MTGLNCGKPVPWITYTVSPSPYGWLTQISGVTPGARAAHVGGGGATGPIVAVVAFAARAPELFSSIPSQVPPPSRTTAASIRAHHGSTARDGGRGLGSASGLCRRRTRRVGGPCPAPLPPTE